MFEWWSLDTYLIRGGYIRGLRTYPQLYRDEYLIIDDRGRQVARVDGSVMHTTAGILDQVEDFCLSHDLFEGRKGVCL